MKNSTENKKRLQKTLIRRGILIVLAVILGINFYMLNASRLLGNQLPMPFGRGIAVVLSGSMEPNLSVDDLIFVREENQYRVGDVVVYQSGNTLIVHRIIAIEGEMLITQGDANNGADAPIEKSAIKGKVTGSIPGIGIVIYGLKTPLGIVVTIAAAILLIEGSYKKEQKQHSDELESIREEIRRLKEEEEKH